MEVVAGDDSGHTVFLGPLNSELRGLIGREMSHTAISVENGRGRACLRASDIRRGIDLLLHHHLSIAVNLSRAVTKNAPQIGLN